MVTLIKHGVLFLYMFLLAAAAQAETRTYDVVKFSDRYYAKATENDETFTSTIRIYDRKHPKNLIITMESEASFGEAEHNVHELPYGRHSGLIYEDFNFDGRKDLALMDGQFSCYNGPSYQVYLANEKSGFTHSAEFTRLAQDYCGFFSVDEKTKTISVMTKSGYAWHLYETYKVVRSNHLRRIYSLTEDGSFSQNFFGEIIIKGSGKNAKTTFRYTMKDDSTDPVFAFRLKSAPHKEIMLFLNYEAEYALLNRKTNLVEYSYELAAKGIMPASKKYRDRPIAFDTEKNSVCFGIGDTSYTVIDQPKRLGVLVKQGKRVTFLAGDPDTRFGDLTKIQTGHNVEDGSCTLE
jgi:hypothetical protein